MSDARTDETVMHTPGPWHWHKSLTRQHLHNEAGSCFAQVSMPSPHNMGISESPRYRANAALIAAAPDLLASLREVLGWYLEGGHAVPRIYIDRAKAAIAKVEDRS